MMCAWFRHRHDLHLVVLLLLQCFSAVVGPNGSGKSNVIDAMLFVFGRRAKQVGSGSVLAQQLTMLPCALAAMSAPLTPTSTQYQETAWQTGDCCALTAYIVT